jgi:glycerol-3-phosphate acyltransferase PlsY
MFDADASIGWLVALLGGAYLLGGCSPGYWLVRWCTGKDVRATGSHSTGATNAGRVLGPGGFVAVLLVDALKGAGGVAAAEWQELDGAMVHAVALAIVAGHVWPVQLGFRGGRGVAPLLGAWLLLSPLALVPCLLAALLALVAFRRFTISGLFGLTLLPVSTWWFSRDGSGAVITALIVAIVLYAHRDHLRRMLQPSPDLH